MPGKGRRQADRGVRGLLCDFQEVEVSELRGGISVQAATDLLKLSADAKFVRAMNQ